MKDYYVQVSRGLFTREHRKRMGIAIWEFEWFLDRVTEIDDNEIGWVYGGKPINLDDISVATSIPSVSRNINKLIKCRYILVIYTPYGMKIGVMKCQKRFIRSDKPRFRSDKPNIREDTREDNIFAKAKNKPLKDKKMFRVWNEELGDWEDYSRKKPKPNPLREPAEELLRAYTKGYSDNIGKLEDMPRVPKEMYLRQAYGVLKMYKLEELLNLLPIFFEEEFYRKSNWSIQTFLSYKVLNTLKTEYEK